MAVDAIAALDRPRGAAVQRAVMLALLPAIGVKTIVFGIGVPVQLLISVLFATIAHAGCAWWRQLPPGDPARQASPILSALLFALCLPPLAPWWIAALGASLAIALGKHALGDGRAHVFNPAMLGFVAMLFAFPAELNAWPAPRLDALTDSASMLSAIFFDASARDALAQATPLTARAAWLAQGHTLAEFTSGGLIFGASVALAFLAGGAWLWRRGVIAWQAPVGLLTGLCAPAMIAWLADASRHASPLHHAIEGGAMMAAWFVVTDPGNGVRGPRVRFALGVIVGAMTWWLRERGALADGVAVAVLLANALAPGVARIASTPARAT